MNKTVNTKAWSLVLPRVAAGGLLLRGDPADDREVELFRAGCFRRRFYRLTTNLEWFTNAGERTGCGTPLGRQIFIFGDHSGHRNPAGQIFVALNMPKKRVLGVAVSGF